MQIYDDRIQAESGWKEFSTVHSALVSFMQVYADRIQAVKMELLVSSILILLGYDHHKPV